MQAYTDLYSEPLFFCENMVDLASGSGLEKQTGG